MRSYFVKFLLAVFVVLLVIPQQVYAADNAEIVITKDTIAKSAPAKKSTKKKTSKKSTKAKTSSSKPKHKITKKPTAAITPKAESKAKVQPSNSGSITPAADAPEKNYSASLVTKDPAIRTRTVEISKNLDFISLMQSLGFNKTQIGLLGQRILLETGYSIKNAEMGQKVILKEKIEANKKKLLEIKIPTKKYIVKVYKDRNGMVKIDRQLRSEAPAEEKSRFFYRSAVIQTTLSDLGDKISAPRSVFDKAVRVISSMTNTAKIKKGDKLELLFEYTYNNAGKQTGIRLLYVNLISKTAPVEGFRFAADEKDTGEFYDVSGNSFTKSMLASPLKGRHKISSGFGYRTHPILGRRIMHTGVDFKAKYGEAIYAAGDGTIDKFGRYGGYGNFIRIKHDSTWSTAYAHMSGYAKGLYLWKRVKKGELIGYVGSTGSSTGPHLHFELQQNGTQINPLKAKLPKGGKKLIGKSMNAFRQETNRIKGLVNSNKNR